MTEKTVRSLERELARAHRLAAKEQARLERERARQRLDDDWQEAKSRLMYEMSRHIGRDQAIGAGELYEIVFQEPYQGNKMTGTRRLRKAIEELKYGPEEIFIAASCCTVKPGYYLPRTDSERREYSARKGRQLKKAIGRLGRLNQMNAADYAGQLALELQETERT